MSWAMTHCDLREIVRRAAAVLTPSAADKNIALKLHIPEAQSVWADPDRVQEVVTNLIDNGIKFCSRGGHIKVRMHRVSVRGPSRLPGRYVRIEVIDDGPGIRLDERDRVFEKFYQGTRADSDGSGSGLGLDPGHFHAHKGWHPDLQGIESRSLDLHHRPDRQGAGT
jgi:signal transduction histidine kinase